MSINQDALEDLASTTGMSEEELKNSASSIAPPEPIKVNVSPNMVGDQTPVTQEVLNRLNHPSTQLAIMRDGIRDVFEMDEIQKEIAGAAKINIADTTRIIPRFEGFDKAFNPRSFTSEPTRTNFILANGYMENQIKHRKEQICQQASNFFMSTMTGAEDALEDYRTFHGVQVKEELTEFALKFAELQKDPQWQDKQNVLFGLDEVNLLTSPVTWCDKVDSLGEHFDAVLFEKFKQAAVDFAEFMDKNAFAGPLIRAIQNNYSPEELVEAEERANGYGRVYNPLNLMEALSNPYTLTLLDRFEKAALASIEELRTAEKNASFNPGNFNEVTDFVTANGAIFDNATGYTHYYGESVDTLRRLLMPATAMLDYFSANK